MIGALGAALPRVIAAAILLQLFFGLVKSKWPASYYSSSDVVSSTISQTWYRYVSFRFGPVVIAAGLVSVTGPNEAGLVFLSAVLFGLVHASLTCGRSLASAARKQAVTARLLLVEFTVFALIIGSAFAGALLSPLFRQYVPGFDKYVEVLLTGIVAALAYTYISRWTSGASDHYPAASELINRIDSSLLAMTVASAARHKVDQDLALAVLISETLQRPKWLRLAESLGGKIRMARTHGPFQNLLNSRGSDEDSVEEAMANLSGATVQRGAMGINRARLHFDIERHNRSQVFIELCESIYYTLAAENIATTSAVGLDGTPLLRVRAIKRQGGVFEISGDTASEVELIVTLVRDSEFRLAPAVIERAESRKTWHVDLSIDYDCVLIFIPSVTADNLPMQEELASQPIGDLLERIIPHGQVIELFPSTRV